MLTTSALPAGRDQALVRLRWCFCRPHPRPRGAVGPTYPSASLGFLLPVPILQPSPYLSPIIASPFSKKPHWGFSLLRSESLLLISPPYSLILLTFCPPSPSPFFRRFVFFSFFSRCFRLRFRPGPVPYSLPPLSDFSRYSSRSEPNSSSLS